MVKNFRYYTTGEIARIRELAATGKSAREIGEIVGRTHRAIEQLCHCHGISRSGRRRGNPTPTRSAGRWKNPYTEAELNTMRRMAEAKASRAQIAAELGRPIGSIHGTCAYYGIKTEGGRTPHPPEVVEKVRELAALGHTRRKISEITGVPFDTLGSICRRHFIKTARHKIDPNWFQKVSPVGTFIEEKA